MVANDAVRFTVMGGIVGFDIGAGIILVLWWLEQWLMDRRNERETADLLANRCEGMHWKYRCSRHKGHPDDHSTLTYMHWNQGPDGSRKAQYLAIDEKWPLEEEQEGK